MRHAFVMGSNGPTRDELGPLHYARQDAEQMKACLSSARCSFTVHMPVSGMDTFEVRRQLPCASEAYQPEDTFVCYFSGHGTLEKGHLMLLWDDADFDRLLSTAFPVSEILQVAIQHEIEMIGIPTVLITLLPEQSRLAGPPRAIAPQHFKLGNCLGGPHQNDIQRKVLRDTLRRWEAREELGNIWAIEYPEYDSSAWQPPDMSKG